MDKERILFTGGTGFIGSNVLPMLEKSFIVFAPNRKELNLFDENAIRRFITGNHINYIVHCANPNPSKNNLDKDGRMLRDSLQMFFAVISCESLVKKIVYLGSGAIYDKTKDISSIEETKIHRSMPVDDYGFAKYIMDKFTRDNIYNLCVFGCYGPNDAESKFITHCIRCVLKNESITIRQDCLFDYLHVYDLGRIISWILSNDVRYHTYNACSGKKISLLSIAQEVKKQMNSDLPIVIAKDGMNLEYTASNERLLREYHEDFISIEEGISMQIKWEKEHFKG